MKKFLSVLFSLSALFLVIFTLASCGDSEKSCTEGGTVHNWGSYKTVAPTCVESGKKVRECKDCGELEYDTSYEGKPATGVHTYGEDGLCTVCGVNRCSIGEHNWSANYVTTRATCVQAGSRYRVCLICNEKEYDEAYAAKFPATGNHSFTTEGVCTVCGTKCEHNYVFNSLRSTEPTCTESGVNYYQCSKCRNVKEEEVDPAGHKFADGDTGVVTEPTCSLDGYTTFVCTVCNSKVKLNVVPATGKHTLGEWIITKNETDYIDGERIKKCSVCAQTIETEVIAHRKNFDELTIKNFLYTGGKYSNTPFVNIASYGMAEASNYYRTTSAKNIIDGSLSTYWQADTLVEGGELTGSSVVILLAKEYDVGAISLTIPNYTSWELGEGCYVSYKIEAYVDGEWIELGEISDKDANDKISENATATLKFASPVATDRLRATVTHSTRYTPAKIHEVEVYGYAEEILRESKNIGANASISISGKFSEYDGGNGSNLVDGNLSKGWNTNARHMMQGDNAITKSIIEFKSQKGISTEFVQISNIEIELEKTVGEKVRLYYYTVKEESGRKTTSWNLIPINGADEDGWYTIKDTDGDTVKISANITDPILTNQIKIQADGYLPEGEYMATTDDYPPTVTSVNLTYKKCTINGTVDTTYEEKTEIGEDENGDPIYKTEIKNRSEADIMADKIALAVADGSDSSYAIKDISWTAKVEVYTVFRYSSEQFITYIAWMVPSTKAAEGKEYKLYIEKDGKWIDYANPNPGTDGRYIVPYVSGQSKYTFNIDISDNITAFKIQMIYEPSNGLGDMIYEIMPYTVVENEVDPTQYTGCKHNIMLSVKDEEGNVISVAPTCTTAGYTEYKCNICGKYIAKTDATDALGHSWGDYRVTKAATTTLNGERTATCTVCGETKTQTISSKLFGVSLEQPTVTRYFHNAPAAWSMTFDDGNYISTYEWILPRLEEYGFRATAVLAMCYAESYIPRWQKYFDTGLIDLGSHSMTHGGYYHDSVSEGALISDVNDAQFKFMANFHKQRLLGFATPNGATSDDVAKYLMDILGAGRNGGGWFNNPDELNSRGKWGNLDSYVSKYDQTEGTYEYVLKSDLTRNYVYNEAANRLTLNTSANGTYYYDSDNYRYEWREGGSFRKVGDNYEYVSDNSGEYILAHTVLGSYETAIDRLLNEGSWSVECIHQILESHEAIGGVIHVSYDATMSKLEYLKKTGVWVCSYTDAIQYLRESQNAEINYKSVEGNKITLELTQTLDNFMFNHALTIKTQLPEYWTASDINVTQNGENVYFVVEDGYCYLDAVPNGGDIVISYNG